MQYHAPLALPRVRQRVHPRLFPCISAHPCLSLLIHLLCPMLISDVLSVADFNLIMPFLIAARNLTESFCACIQLTTFLTQSPSPDSPRILGLLTSRVHEDCMKQMASRYPMGRCRTCGSSGSERSSPSLRGPLSSSHPQAPGLAC